VCRASPQRLCPVEDYRRRHGLPFTVTRVGRSSVFEITCCPHSSLDEIHPPHLRFHQQHSPQSLFSSSTHATTMLHYRTEGYNGYAIKDSPFVDNRLACAASADFGLVGNGRLYILGLTAQGIVGEKWFDTQDGLFDTAWSEIHENQIGVASGDGSIKLFDI